MSDSPIPDGQQAAPAIPLQDDKALELKLGHQPGRVVVQFSKSIPFFVLGADEAIGLAQGIIQHARAAGSTRPLVHPLLHTLLNGKGRRR